MLNRATVLLVVLLGWLLLSPPRFTFASRAGTYECNPIVGGVESYPLDYFRVDPKVVQLELSSMYDRAEGLSDVDAGERHAAGVLLAACQDARVNRQTHAVLTMLALAIMVIPRLCLSLLRKHLPQVSTAATE